MIDIKKILLWHLDKLKKELFGVTELRFVTVEALEHLEFVHFRQYFQQAAQLLRAYIIVTSIFDQLDDVLVRTEWRMKMHE